MKNVIGTIKVIKQIHKKDIVLIKIGKFYYAYGKDAYILSYLFSYKMRTLEEQIKVCAFPVLALNKIISKLEKNKINYILVDKRNQYEGKRLMKRLIETSSKVLYN